VHEVENQTRKKEVGRRWGRKSEKERRGEEEGRWRKERRAGVALAEARRI
jgi:hypothetical protein